MNVIYIFSVTQLHYFQNPNPLLEVQVSKHNPSGFGALKFSSHDWFELLNFCSKVSSFLNMNIVQISITEFKY